VTVDHVIDNFDHVRDLVGIEHVGIGSDAGIESNDLGAPELLKEMLAKADRRYHVHGTHEVVPGLQGQKRIYDLTAAFVRRGYTDEHIRLVLGRGRWATFGMPDATGGVRREGGAATGLWPLSSARHSSIPSCPSFASIGDHLSEHAAAITMND
jgi:Membrane dipeptidase (Peptidase family M19)